MRVVIVAAWPPWPLTEGDRLVMHHQLTHLAAHHEVSVLAAGRWSDPPRPEDLDGRSYTQDLVYLPSQPRTAITYLGLRARSVSRREPRQVCEVDSRALHARFLRLLRDEPPDLVHLFGWGTAQLAHAVPTGIGVVHSAIDAWGLGHGNRARSTWQQILEMDQRHWVTRHERRHYPRADAVVVVSRADASYLERHVPGVRTVVIPNGVVAGPAPRRRPQPGLIGLHGNFGTYANIEAARRLVDDILPEVRRWVPGAHGRIIGRNPPPELVARSGDGVVVTGEVDDIRAELDQLDVYVAPMLRGTGIKNKVLEAMAAGLPVVTTSAVADAVPGQSALVVADSPDAMVAEVARLLNDRDANERQGVLAREAALTELDWAVIARQLDDVWGEVAARARARRSA
jgi:glycosyltransferase involved in cell wall biosynthesis